LLLTPEMRTVNQALTLSSIATSIRAAAGPSVSPLYIGASQVTAAYSTRLLNPAYTGPLLKVRRSIDNATMDVYPSASPGWPAWYSNGLRSPSDLPSVNWPKSNLTVTANTTAAPDGSLTADTLTVTAAGTATYLFGTAAMPSNTANKVITLSGRFHTSSTGGWIYFQAGNALQTEMARVWFNVTTGQLGTSQIAGAAELISATVTAEATGWNRVSITVKLSITINSTATMFISAVNGNGTAGFPAVGGTYVDWGLQWAEGFASSPVRLLTASVRQQLPAETANTWLDAAAMLAWVGSADAFVERRYDQSGNGVDDVQLDPLRQPRIAFAGNLENINGRPALRFMGGQFMKSLPFAGGMSEFTGISVGYFDGMSAYQRMLSLASTTGATDWNEASGVSLVSRYAALNNLSIYRTGTRAVSSNIFPSRPFVGVGMSRAAGNALWVNGNAGASSTTYSAPLGAELELYTGNEKSNSGPLFGCVGESIFVGSALSDADRAAFETAAMSAWSTA
jgi:hypothetical protein